MTRTRYRNGDAIAIADFFPEYHTQRVCEDCTNDDHPDHTEDDDNE